MKLWGSEQNNREAAFAGQFYPGSRASLENKLEELFAKAAAPVGPDKSLRAVISPHAGYVFSGKVAASAFNQIPENARYERVFVLASSHRYRFNGAAVFTEGNYETPLGEIEVDLQLAKKLVKSSDAIVKHTEAHLHEHSLEVQLPFLQYKLGNNFKLVPLIVGTNRPEECKKIASALKPWFNAKNLFVISTDFSHYPDYEDAQATDRLTADAICTNKAEKLLETLEKTKSQDIKNLATSLCGWTSVMTLLYLTENRNYTFGQVDYQNSGDARYYGDKDRVVGYWAIAVFDEDMPFRISEAEKKEIISKAKNAIRKYLETGKRGKPLPTDMGGILAEKAGVFVSIYIDNELRGCIGGFAQEKTLSELVQHMAVSAACDRRFDNIGPEELDKMELEISVLSPLKRIKSADEIELGRHGIYIKKDLNSGTFLPQVAEKTGWDVNEFLGRCSRDKAGLGWDGWKTAELYTYEAVIFRSA